MIDVSAARGDMNDACSFTSNDVGIAARVATAVDHAMALDTGCGVVFINRNATLLLLCLQVIKRPE